MFYNNNICYNYSIIILCFQSTNKEHVESCFASGILRNKVLTPHQAGQLVMFMANRWQDVFQCPTDVESTVQFRLNQLGSGMELEYPPLSKYSTAFIYYIWQAFYPIFLIPPAEMRCSETFYAVEYINLWSQGHFGLFRFLPCPSSISHQFWGITGMGLGSVAHPLAHSVVLSICCTRHANIHMLTYMFLCFSTDILLTDLRERTETAGTSKHRARPDRADEQHPRWHQPLLKR